MQQYRRLVESLILWVLPRAGMGTILPLTGNIRVSATFSKADLIVRRSRGRDPAKTRRLTSNLESRGFAPTEPNRQIPQTLHLSTAYPKDSAPRQFHRVINRSVLYWLSHSCFLLFAITTIAFRRITWWLSSSKPPEIYRKNGALPRLWRWSKNLAGCSV